MHRLLPLLVVLVLLGVVSQGQACPLCQQTATQTAEASEDPERQALAYNRSIYLMLTMPYLLLGVIGYKVYRGLKAAEVRHQTGPALAEFSSRDGESAN